MPTQEHEDFAWQAYQRALRPVRMPKDTVRFGFDHTVRIIPEWELRGAPSVGARAAVHVREMLMNYPPSFVRATEEALGLYLADWQQAEREGFKRKRGGFKS